MNPSDLTISTKLGLGFGGVIGGVLTMRGVTFASVERLRTIQEKAGGPRPPRRCVVP